MKIHNFGVAIVIAVFLSTTGAYGEESSTREDYLVQQANQLEDSLINTSDSSAKLYALATGMSDQVKGMLYEYRANPDNESLRSAQDRVNTITVVIDYLEKAYYPADHLLSALKIYNLIANRADKQRIAPLLARVRDRQVKAMDRRLNFLEGELLPRFANVSSANYARTAIVEYRAIQQLMVSMQF